MASLRWQTPADIPNHPELRELSPEGLSDLLTAILEECDSMAMLRQQVGEQGLTGSLEQQFADAWLDDLIAAQDAVSEEMTRQARRRPEALAPEEFAAWAAPGL